MLKTFKKILCSLLVVVMCLTSAPLQGFVGIEWPGLPEINFGELFVNKATAKEVASSGSCGNNVTYTYNSSTGELIISGTGAMKNYSGSTSPFYDSDIKSVIIEEGVTTIGNYAFWKCADLTSVTIPSGMISIGSDAFYECESIKNISLPNTVEIIESYAFSRCHNLEEISIPNSVQTIERYAFEQCFKLKTFVFPEGVTYIGEYLFLYCYDLASVTIPKSITKIYTSAFSRCNSLTDIYYLGSDYEWNLIEISLGNNPISNATIHFAEASHVHTSETVLIPATCAENGMQYDICTFCGEILSDVTTLPASHTPGAWEVVSEATDQSEGKEIVKCKVCKEILEERTIPKKPILDDNLSATGQCGENVFWTYNRETGKLVIHGEGDMDFKMWASSPFAGSKIRSLVIDEGVTGIGEQAFARCDYLGEITLSDSLIKIADNAFLNCKYYKDDSKWENGALYIGKHLIRVYNFSAENRYSIKEGTICIADGAFKYSNFEYIDIPNAVKYIGKEAFSYCKLLNSMKLPENLLYLGKFAFEYCESLVEITIPNSLTECGGYVFVNSGIKKVTFSYGTMKIFDGLCASMKLLEILDMPDTISKIGESAFEGCLNLKGIKLNSEMTYIGNRAFTGCSSIKEILVSSNLEYAYGAFYQSGVEKVIFEDGTKKILKGICDGMGSLKSVAIPDTVKSIEDYAFSLCTSLENIIIPDSVSNVGIYAFNHCIDLKNITIPASVVLKSTSFDDCYNITDITISKGTGIMTEYSFFSSMYTPWYHSRENKLSITIENGVTNISDYAFYNCVGLNDIIVPDSVISIGSSAFYNCDGLSDITFSNKIISIDSGAFSNCDGLTEIIIPDNIRDVGSAFSHCSNLKSIAILGEKTNIKNYAFYECVSLTDITISANTYIDVDTFGYCSNLANIKILKGNGNMTPTIRRIWMDSINNDINIELQDGIENISKCAFRDLIGLKTLVIPDSVMDIEKEAFYGCKSISSITIPKNVINIGDKAFQYCTSLESIDIPNNITYIGDEAFRECTNLNRVNLPNALHKIGNYTFYNCDSLVEITLPNNIVSLGNSSFENCDNLNRIVIPNSVTQIGGSAFRNCKKLNTVYIGNSVNEIGGYAFNPCSVLNFIHYNGSEEDWNKISKERTSIDSKKTTILYDSIEPSSGYQDESLQSSNFSFDNPSYIITYDSKSGESISGFITLIYQADASGIEGFDDSMIEFTVSDPNVIVFEKSMYIGPNSTKTAAYVFCSLKAKKVGDAVLTAELPDGSKTTCSILVVTPDEKKLLINKANADNNDILIIPQSGHISELFSGVMIGVKFMMNSIQEINTHDDKEFKISANTQVDSIILSKNEFRDYKIPKEVVDSWKKADVEEMKNSSTPSYEHKAFMEKDRFDGKPYISTVFARERYGTYKNVMSSSLKINSGKVYDVIISAADIGSGVCTYFIEQDTNHKICNNTGVFKEEDLFSVLDYGRPCYCYVKLNDGTVSELVEIKLERDATSLGGNVEEFFKESTFNLLGKDFVGFTVPEDIPLLGDAEISFQAFKLPVGFEIDGDSVKISIGANIFNAKQELKKNSYDKYKKWSRNCFKDWKDLVDGTTMGEAFDKTVKNHTDAKEEYKKAKENFERKIWNSAPPLKKKSKNWDVEALGYIDASIVNGQLVVNEALISIEGSFTFKYTQQGAIWVVPAYVYAEMGASLGGSALGSRVVPDSEIPFQWDFSIKFSPDLKVGAGAGVKDFASLGIWAKAETPVVFNFSDNHLKWDLTGSIGIEAQFIILKGTKEVFSGSKNLVDKYWDTTSKMRRVVTSFANDMVMMNANTNLTSNTSVADRAYLENTTGWLGEVTPFSLRQLAEDGLTLTPLQGSVYDQASPRVVSFGDKMLMTWVEDDASRDTYNRMRLMYSIYNGSTWSEPVAVYDDGHNDNAPVITTDGEDVYFAWQKIDETITETNCNIETLTENCEIFTSKYDSSLGRVVDVKQVTDNNCYDYAHNVSVVGDEVVYYWATCNDNQMNTSSDNDIYRLAVDGTAKKIASDLNYILSIDAAEVDGKESVSYSMDADGDTTIANDIAVYTLTDGSVTAFDKGDNDVAYPVAFYGELAGEETLFVSDMTDIYYMQNGELKNVLDEYTAIGGNINYHNKNGTPYLLWTQNEAVGNAVYSSAYENGEWTTPVKVSNTETQLSSVDVAIYNNEFMGVCTSTDLEYNEDDESYELGQINLCSFKIAEVQDISVDDIYIDENNIVIGEETKFDVYVTNYGTTNIKNIKFNIVDELGFESTVEKEVNLLSGEGKFIELTYIAPENYGKTTLSVTAVCDEIVDSNSDNDTSVAVIGIPDIVLTESELIELDGSYILNAMITNESDVSASDVVINTKINDSEDIVDTITLATIEARETHLIEYVLTEDDLVFDEETNVAKVCISVDTEDKDITANKICFIIEKSAENDSGCSHKTLELIGRVEPTCTEVGYTGVKQCVECSKIIDLNTEIVANGHNYGEWYISTPAKCETVGEARHNCLECNYYENQQISAIGHSFNGSKCSNCGYDKTESCSCKCHKTGFITKLIWKFTNFFNKLLKKNQICSCGVYHY